ncbi:hypothetical protein VP01_1945g2, partial [Puccinia sorghi]
MSEVKMNLEFGNSQEGYNLTFAYKEGLKWHFFPQCLKFDLFLSGNTFKPFEKLMFFLQKLISDHISPEFCCKNSYKLNPFFFIKEFMIGLESPIVDLYPLCDSKMTLNGRNLNWEAIFKIPFTYQEIILESIKGQKRKFNPSIWEPMSTNFWMKNVGETSLYQLKNFSTMYKYLSYIHPPSL